MNSAMDTASDLSYVLWQRLGPSIRAAMRLWHDLQRELSLRLKVTEPVSPSSIAILITLAVSYHSMVGDLSGLYLGRS